MNDDLHHAETQRPHLPPDSFQPFFRTRFRSGLEFICLRFHHSYPFNADEIRFNLYYVNSYYVDYPKPNIGSISEILTFWMEIVTYLP